ncbi:5' nucleotidase, NT5C type [Sodalis sp. RH22]|uniref:5' nucleotidase, NT5C type n=1 Tax=unclassified Sodalis (in: enterobacteria) TaxID=2636512 RepID=UPI0039B6C947
MQTIAIDMDEVIADFNSKMIRHFNAEFGEHIGLNDLAGQTIQQLRPALREKINQMIGEPAFFSDLDVIAGAQDVVRELSGKYHVFITTAAMEFPASFTAKFNWLQTHFGFLSAMNFVFCGNKRILNADFLIDDNVRHFEHFVGEGILFTAPHNIHARGYRRVNDWREVADLFL